MNVWTNGNQGDISPNGGARPRRRRRRCSTCRARRPRRNIAGQARGSGIVARLARRRRRHDATTLAAGRPAHDLRLRRDTARLRPVGPLPCWARAASWPTTDVCAPAGASVRPGHQDPAGHRAAWCRTPRRSRSGGWARSASSRCPPRSPRRRASGSTKALVAESGGRLSELRARRPHQLLPLLHGDAGGVRRLHLRGQLHAVRPRPGPALPRRRRRTCSPRCSRASDPASLPEPPRSASSGAAARPPTRRPTPARPVAQPADTAPLRARDLQLEGRRPGRRRSAQRDLRRAPAQGRRRLDHGRHR